jgi:hypothetical protein
MNATTSQMMELLGSSATEHDAEIALALIGIAAAHDDQWDMMLDTVHYLTTTVHTTVEPRGLRIVPIVNGDMIATYRATAPIPGEIVMSAFAWLRERGIAWENITFSDFCNAYNMVSVDVN